MNFINLSVSELIKEATQLFQQRHIESAEVEAQWLLLHILKWKRSDLWMKSDQIPGEMHIRQFEEAVKERLSGRPVQYICGETDFFGHIFKVGEGVLIPRPETEILVEKSIDFLSANPGDVLDLCTGSGAILLTIALESPNTGKCIGVDISPEALKFARKNADSLLKENSNVEILEGDLFEPLPAPNHQFSLIVSNPPYVTEEEYAVLPQNVKEFEPKLALTAPDEGLAILKRIAALSPAYLQKYGMIICEMGEEQGPASKEIFSHFFEKVTIIQDYTGRDRFVQAEKPIQS